MGLLSLIDAMLELPMEKVLEMIPLDKETKAVLLGQASLLRPVHQLMLAHESGEWEAAARVAESMHLDKEETASLYLEAQQWARDISAGM
jgi:c-di-GMP-related signal transduction protein